jgi:hypothetical protein
MSDYGSTTYQPRASRPASLGQLLGAGCFLLLALLLLAQPLFCVIQCSLDGHSGHHHHMAADDPTALFVCHTPEAAYADSLIIPPYWPAVLPLALAFALMCCALLTLSMRAPATLCARAWAPPLPPPRLLSAA